MHNDEDDPRLRLRRLYVTTGVGWLLESAVLGAATKAEVCGLLGGFLEGFGTAVATVVHPLQNLCLCKYSFAVDVEDFCRERDAIEQKGLVALALYHSHRHGSTQPSSRDRKLPWITDLPALILAWDGGL